MLLNATHNVFSVLCSTFVSIDNLDNLISDASSILETRIVLEAHICTWVGILSCFSVSLLTLVMVLLDRQWNNFLKPIPLRQVSITKSSTGLNKSISSRNKSVSAFSKMLSLIRGFWFTLSNSRIFQIPINILIRLRGWLNRFLSFFPRLFQFFPSLTAWLGLATVESNRFLAPSEAITLGDISYMNAPKKIKRTFAKTKSNPEGGSKVRFVSALQETTTLDNPTAIERS